MGAVRMACRARQKKSPAGSLEGTDGNSFQGLSTDFKAVVEVQRREEPKGAKEEGADRFYKTKGPAGKF